MDIRLEDNNLVDHSDWYTPITGNTAHVGEQIRINASYVSAKNYIEPDIGPHSIEVPIWKTQGFATGYTAGTTANMTTITVGDHSTSGETAQVVNTIYGTSANPSVAASSVAVGTIYYQYTP